MVARLLKRTRIRRLAGWIIPDLKPRAKRDGLTVQNQGSHASLSHPDLIAREEAKPSINLKKMGSIAEASVQLAALGPRLAKLAGEMEAQAQEQARRTDIIAQMMESLTRDLEKAVSDLGANSVQVAEALATVSRISEHTRIISFNASIEAARAGIHGQAFGVIVEEVQRLADRTGTTTHVIEARMGEMKSSIDRVARVAGDRSQERSDTECRGVSEVNEEVHEMARSAQNQLGGSQSLHGMSDQALQLAESLLLAVGTFRFDAHERAEREVELILPDLLNAGHDRHACERHLEQWLSSHPHFELAYVTDAKGRQYIDNLSNRGGQVTHDKTGYGRDWSERPWYKAAISHRSVHSTDIYRSTATGDFCFTVAVALRDAAGQIVGVLGADVNFQILLGKKRAS